MASTGNVVAVLGPTNTGKTHYAIERILAHRTGVIGLPLRLLAREVYDRIVALRGPSVVALVTGEERIVPERTQYWVCTVEAMPDNTGPDFLAIDEVQLCADPERGHVFTDRLLRARGTHETLFLGAATMRGAIADLVPEVQFMARPRLSNLAYVGSKKISRMPPRSAIVGFSVENVYAIAELLRRQKGGAAVVMGALSPRTRNAQVAMYQAGEVDHLVATDAIGMGLNLDIHHVAFAGLSKFDGRRMRQLAPNELAQIAGRAGRHQRDGTFGVTGESLPLNDQVAEAIVNHRFTPLKRLNWRSSALNFGSTENLIEGLEAPPDHERLLKAREANDLRTLKTLSQDPLVSARISDPSGVRLLWDVCRIPDFRGVSPGDHANLLTGIHGHLCEGGTIPDDWLARQIHHVDKASGDIDTLSKRLAYIRTWTYIAQRRGWVMDEKYWREETRAVEDRLSDALHHALTQRFVDRRTSVLMRRLKDKESLVADVSDQGDVTVEGEFVGRLEGFRFRQDATGSTGEAKTLAKAAHEALAPHFHLRAERFYNAPDTEIDFTEQGGLMWGESAVGKLVVGSEPLKPSVEAFVDEVAGDEVATKVQRRLQHFIDRKVATLYEPLLALSKDEELTGLARGFAFQLAEGLGLLRREAVAQDVKALDQDARGALRKHGVRFGQFTIFLPLLLKPAPTRLRLVLWSLTGALQEFPKSPPPGLVTVPCVVGSTKGYDTMSGYREAGARMIRVDMLERLADQIRAENTRAGFEAKPDMLSITGMTLEQFADLMTGLGYKAERGEREKIRVVPVVAVVVEEPTSEGDTPEEAPQEVAEAVTAEAATSEVTTAEAVTAEAVTAEKTPVVAEDAPVQAEETPVQAEETPVQAEETPAPAADEAVETAVDLPEEIKPEVEVFYSFTWAPVRRQNNARPEGRTDDRKDRGPKKGPKKGKKGAPKPPVAREFSARPPKKEKAIDPDNPFAAALMGLRDKT